MSQENEPTNKEKQETGILAIWPVIGLLFVFEGIDFYKSGLEQGLGIFLFSLGIIITIVSFGKFVAELVKMSEESQEFDRDFREKVKQKQREKEDD